MIQKSITDAREGWVSNWAAKIPTSGGQIPNRSIRRPWASINYNEVLLITSVINSALRNLSPANRNSLAFNVILSIQSIQRSIPFHRFLIIVFVPEGVRDERTRLKKLRKPVTRQQFISPSSKKGCWSAYSVVACSRLEIWLPWSNRWRFPASAG